MDVGTLISIYVFEGSQKGDIKMQIVYYVVAKSKRKCFHIFHFPLHRGNPMHLYSNLNDANIKIYKSQNNMY